VAVNRKIKRDVNNLQSIIYKLYPLQHQLTVETLARNESV